MTSRERLLTIFPPLPRYLKLQLKQGSCENRYSNRMLNGVNLEPWGVWAIKGAERGCHERLSRCVRERLMDCMDKDASKSAHAGYSRGLDKRCREVSLVTPSDPSAFISPPSGF
jgi:hypothetical protein